jgi:hypothetical protein
MGAGVVFWPKLAREFIQQTVMEIYRRKIPGHVVDFNRHFREASILSPSFSWRRCGQTAVSPRKISVCGAVMASLLMSGRSRRRLRRGRGLLGIVGFFAAAREQAEGRAQQTGQDEFLHGIGLVFECDCSRQKYSELPG